MAKVEFTTSARKQVWLLIGFFVCLGVLAALTRCSSVPYKLQLFAGLSLVLAVTTFAAVRRTAKMAKCPSCGVDLFEIIGAAQYRKVSFKHCPSCGVAVEV